MLQIDEPSANSSLLMLIADTCEKFNQRVAFKSFGTSITYRQLDRLSNNFANHLAHKMNIKKGDRVCLLLPNVLQFPIALIGIFKAGAIAVALNPLYTEQEIKKSMEDSGAKIIITLDLFLDKFKKIEKELNLEAVIVSSVGEHLPKLKANLIQFTLKYIKKVLPRIQLERVIQYSDLISPAKTDYVVKPSVKNEDLALIQYTGGTTGTPSGVMLSHGNISSNIAQTYEWTADQFTEKDVILTPLPVYHILSLVGNLFCFMRYGVTNVLLLNARDLKSLVKAIKKEKPTFISGVDTLFAALVKFPGFLKIKSHSFRFCVAGGMALRREVSEQWQRITGLPIIQGYGLSEASPIVTLNKISSSCYSPTVGLPLPNTKIKIVDQDYHAVLKGETGEICVHGPQVMKGYWKNEDKTSQAIDPEGWLRTGDLGYIDQNNELTIVDRIKDLIIISGFNVFPSEIEEAVLTREDIIEAAAVSSFDNGVESIKLYLVPKSMQSLADKDEIKAYIGARLAPYKVPKNIHFIAELPKSNIGKILKRSL
jgi:long-chain acyl-CoA synthetase